MRTVISTTLLCAVLCYFAYNALSGDQGLSKWTSLQKQEKLLTQELDIILAEKEALTLRIERLRPESLDLDYVEELARKKLAYAREDEIILKLPQE